MICGNSLELYEEQLSKDETTDVSTSLGNGHIQKWNESNAK